jgi:hypothetical protein
MQPFTIKTLYTVIIAALSFAVCYFLLNDKTGLIWLFLRSLLFISLFLSAVFAMNLTPDLKPVLQTIKRRLRI